MRILLVSMICFILWTGSALAQPFAYITNTGNPAVPGTVSVIDTATNTVVATVNVGGGPFGVAVTPDGSFAYVTNIGDGTVSVIDALTNTVVGSPITVGIAPFGVAVTPDGNFVYVSNGGDGISDGTVVAIDTSTNTVVGSPITVGIAPFGVAVTPDGNFVYVANVGPVGGTGDVSVIDTSTNTVIATIVDAPPVSPFGIVVSPDGSRVYVANDQATVSVIDTSTNMVTASVPVVMEARGIEVTPDGNFVYVVNLGVNNVSVIDTSTNTVVGSPITVGNLPFGIAITPDGAFAYAANTDSNTVSVIDTSTNTVVGPPIAVGSMPNAFGKFIGPDPTPDLSVVKSGFPDPVVVEESLAYTIFVVNFGQGIGTSGVTLTDTLPSDVTFVSATSDQGSCSETAGVVTCDIGTMGEGDIVQVDILVTAPSTAGAILNVADVTSNFPDTNPGDNHTEIITQIISAPVPTETSELLIIKSDTPDPVVVGTPLTYNLFIANLGPDDATGVVVTDTLPPSVTFDSAPGCTEMSGVVTCNVGALASGGVLSFALNVTPNLTGVIFNLAQVAGDQLDPAPGNNVAGETTTVVDVPVVVPMADLLIIKSDSPDPVTTNNLLTYVLFVTNAGPDPATGVTITDTLPANADFISATSDQGNCGAPAGNVLTCNLGDLGVGEFTQVMVLVTPTVPGTILNIAQVTGNEQDPEPSNNISPQTTTVEPEPVFPPDDPPGPTGNDLFVLKFVSPNPAEVGDEITFTIIVGNNGQFGSGVTLVDTLPAGLTSVSANSSTGEPCNEAGDQITCDLGSVPPLGQGEIVTVEIIVRADQTGTFPNIALLEGNPTDPNTTNNVAIVTVDVVSGGGDPSPTPSPTPTDPGDSDSSSSSSSCSLVAGNPNGGDSAFNLGLLLLPLFVIGLRAVRRRK